MEWADYGMWKVEYDHEKERIIKAMVLVHPHYHADETQEMSRQDILDSMQEGKTFIAVSKTGNIWRKGLRFYLVDVDGEPYIRMQETKIAMDSHRNLPEY